MVANKIEFSSVNSITLFNTMSNLDFESILSSHNLATEAVSRNVCCCCLDRNEVMINVRDCKHNEFIKEYLTMDVSRLLVCRSCHNMLKQIMIFRQQVQESCEMLKHSIIPHKLNKLYHSLQYSDITITSSLKNEIKIEKFKKHDYVDPKEELTNDDNSYQMPTDIKTEPDSSDCENDLPLSQMKKKEPDKVTHQLLSVDKIYEGKIGLLIMTKEQLMLEREKSSMQETYLKHPYKCKSCIKGFDRESTFKSHNERQHVKKINGYQCDICKSYLCSEASYKEHTRRHLMRYICVACGKRATDVYSIADHYNEHHGNIDGHSINIQYQCVKCDYSTRSYRGYRYHLERQHKSKPECDICRKTYATLSSLRKHIESVHTKNPPQYKCTTCNKSYRCKSGLFNHEESHAHGGNPTRTHFCVQCKTHYSTKSSLTQHLKKHSTPVTDEDKRFSCNECGLRFLTKALIKAHIVWEHLKMRHECQQCHKAFRTPGVLRRHIAFVHEKRRPPRNKICDYCGRGFTTAAILESHIRTHTGDRPLKCTHCAATFAHKAALYTHNKLLHK